LSEDATEEISAILSGTSAGTLLEPEELLPASRSLLPVVVLFPGPTRGCPSG
jgi:hypothetical protein